MFWPIAHAAISIAILLIPSKAARVSAFFLYGLLNLACWAINSGGVTVGDTTASGLPEFEMSTWMIIGLLIVGAIIVALHIVLSAALGALMRFRPIAEGVCLQAWAYAQRRKKGSVLRSVLEERIVAIGKSRLRLKRVSSARGVINKINGVEPARRKPSNVVPLRRRDEIRVPDAANDVVRTVRRAA